MNIEKIVDVEFHHFGLATKYPEKSRKYLQMLGYKAQEPHLNIFNVFIQFHEHINMPRIELVYQNQDSSPIDNILKSNDSLIYHTCYKCKDANLVIKQIKEQGFKIVRVSKSTDDFPFSFHFIQGIGLIELFED